MHTSAQHRCERTTHFQRLSCSRKHSLPCFRPASLASGRLAYSVTVLLPHFTTATQVRSQFSSGSHACIDSAMCWCDAQEWIGLECTLVWFMRRVPKPFTCSMAVTAQKAISPKPCGPTELDFSSVLWLQLGRK